MWKMPRQSNKRKNTRASLILIPFSSSDWVLSLKESSWWLDLNNLPVNHGNFLLQSLVLVDTIYLQNHLKKRSSAGVGIMLNGAGLPLLMSSRRSVDDLSTGELSTSRFWCSPGFAVPFVLPVVLSPSVPMSLCQRMAVTSHLLFDNSGFS